MSKNHHAEDIIARYRRGECSPEETAWVESWHLMELSKQSNAISTENLEETQHMLLQSILREKTSTPVVSRRLVKVWWAAAVLITSIFLFSVVYWNRLPVTEESTVEVMAMDISPGSKKATLTVDDGTVVELEEGADLVAVKGSAITYADGSVIGEPVADESSAVLRYNTLVTPNGGEYQIVLGDGTKVWLNAASSLRFPQRFLGHEREVELVGEAYFEVASDKSKPFKVKSKGQILEVLGTHFNVTAYGEERSVRTALLEGAVKVSSEYSKEHVVLRPGQQSIIQAGEKGITVNKADKESVLAWQKGYFLFDDADLESIMKQVERWYDVEVIYASKPTGKTFLGMVSRSRNISAVLSALEKVGNIRFKIDGKKITVFG
ncbi:FecR family protein [Sphingobacterium tabacisoli]|uniref:FecR family protein n=1 Tax=Sphingobacterium tabacisoli TaxID=2044855 RepID=A0ABW5L008_9SPHI|nr:FecR domain-containing protein [Sphingobacterium tabacisoli]